MMGKRCSPGTVCNNCYISLPYAERYVTILLQSVPRMATLSLLHTVAIRGTVCKNLLHSVSLLHTVSHHGVTMQWLYCYFVLGRYAFLWSWYFLWIDLMKELYLYNITLSRLWNTMHRLQYCFVCVWGGEVLCVVFVFFYLVFVFMNFQHTEVKTEMSFNVSWTGIRVCIQFNDKIAERCNLGNII
jgi:hypothetical protein